MIAANHSSPVKKRAIRYDYAPSYNFSTEKATPLTETITALHPEKTSDKNPLDLLSSAASAVVDDEESTASTISSSTATPATPQGMMTSSFTLSPSRPSAAAPSFSRTLPSRHSPVAYVIRRNPRPRSFLVTPAPSPTLVPNVAPPKAAPLPAFPAPQDYHAPGCLPLPEGMRLTMSHPIPAAVTSSIHQPARSKSPAFVKRPNTKHYKMKYHCVSMKRSEALKYLEAVSNGDSSRAQSYLDHGHQKPIAVGAWKRRWSTPPTQSFRPIAVPSMSSAGATTTTPPRRPTHQIVYQQQLPFDKAVVPPY